MKKTVLAFAVAAAMGVPAVAAADTTLYGRFHVSVDRVDTDAAGSSSDNKLTSRASRIGVRGSEDLGGGLRGVFQMEASMNPVDGGDELAGRDTFVGLAGDFGAVHLGNTNNVYERIIGNVQTFGDSALDARNILSASPAEAVRFRAKNSIFYASPNFSGFQVMAQYGFGDNTASAGKVSDTDTYSIGAVYSQGPLRVFGAYSKVNNSDATKEAEGALIGVRYTIDDLTLAAAYDKVEDNTDSRNAYLLSARYNMGQTFLMGMYGSAGDFNGSDTGATYYGVGAGYNFSRRTSVYAAYAALDNDTNGEYNFSVAGPDGGPNQTPSVFSLGVQHNF